MGLNAGPKKERKAFLKRMRELEIERQAAVMADEEAA